MAQATRTTTSGKALVEKKARRAKANTQVVEFTTTEVVLVDKMFTVREASIVAGVTSGMANEAYASAMNKKFGRQWIEFDGLKASEVGDNMKRTIEVYKAEKKAFYEGLRSKHKEMKKRGECNPSVNWANFKKIVRDMGKVKGPGSGKSLSPEEAGKRNLPSLFKKFNAAPDYDTNEATRDIAHHIGCALKLILSDDEWTTLNQEMGG